MAEIGSVCNCSATLQSPNKAIQIFPRFRHRCKISTQAQSFGDRFKEAGGEKIWNEKMPLKNGETFNCLHLHLKYVIVIDILFLEFHQRPAISADKRLFSV